eukprot:163326_1
MIKWNRRWFQHKMYCCVNDEFTRMDSKSERHVEPNAFNLPNTVNTDTKLAQIKPSTEQNYERFNQMIETLEVPHTALELNTSESKSEHYKSTKTKIKSRTISAHNILLPDPSTTSSLLNCGLEYIRQDISYTFGAYGQCQSISMTGFCKTMIPKDLKEKLLKLKDMQMCQNLNWMNTEKCTLNCWQNVRLDLIKMHRLEKKLLNA